jgi:hypothetical protein
LQVSAERRGSRLTGKAYYSFGRGYEDVDFQGGGLPGVQDATRLGDERARNSNDRTHSLVLSGVWKIDYLRNASSVLGVLARDWTVSAIATFQSGTPLTIGAGTDRWAAGIWIKAQDGISSEQQKRFNSFVGFDAQLNLVQYGSGQIAYNWDCCGVNIEYRRFSLASVRNENQFRFTFALANVGAFGNLRRTERLF